jgi:membrane protein implicated in regulation of membrane protease activity
MMLYALCLVIGLLFIAVSAIFGHFFGGDGHADVGTGGHAEAGFDHSGVPGISFFSPLVMASFVTAFGGFGVIFSGFKATESIWISAPLSILGALAFAFGALWLFNTVFSKTQSSSESCVGTLTGQSASVITPVPENGVGEIAYVQGGTRYTAPARSEGGIAIAAGRPVKISRVVGTQFFIEPLDLTAPKPQPTSNP